MLTFCRLYHVSSAAYSYKKLGLKLNKMINPKTKRQWYPTQLETVAMPTVKSLTKTQNEPGKRAVRRSAMLNKLLMKQVTDLMSTGTVSIDIVGRGVEISKVKITPDLQTVNVFWVCKGDSSDEETDAILNKIAGPLRHELSTLRVMGEVPYIEFVKDKHEAQIVDLDRRLALADYGEDYTPTELGHLLKSEFTLNTQLSPEMQAKIKRLEEEERPIEDPIPEMTHNVYGLDHDKVINRLLAARKKSRDAWSKLGDSSDTVVSYRTTGEASDGGVDVSGQKKELAEFLLKRRIIQNNMYKQLRATSDDWQLDYQKEAEPDDETHHYYDDDDDYYDDDDDAVYKHDLRNKDSDKHS